MPLHACIGHWIKSVFHSIQSLTGRSKKLGSELRMNRFRVQEKNKGNSSSFTTTDLCPSQEGNKAVPASPMGYICVERFPPRQGKHKEFGFTTAQKLCSIHVHMRSILSGWLLRLVTAMKTSICIT